MRYYLFTIFLAIAIACQPKPEPAKQTITYEIEVTYTDMVVDTITATCTLNVTNDGSVPEPWLSRRMCVVLYGDNFACDVRRFTIINKTVN